MGERGGGVGARDESAADGGLGGEPDDGADDAGGAQGGDGAVDVAWVGGEEGADDEEEFTRAVRGGVAAFIYISAAIFFLNRRGRL